MTNKYSPPNWDQRKSPDNQEIRIIEVRIIEVRLYLVVQILHLILLERVVPAGNDSLGSLVSSNLATSIILLFHRTDNY